MMSHSVRALLAVLALSAAFIVGPGSAHADIGLGQPLPVFTKSVLGGGTLASNQYNGKVLVLALVGYGCPFCIADGPSVQSNIAQAYAQTHPGQVQVVGVDMWNGTAAQMNSFRQQTGATFPLALNGATASGGNVELLVGPFDNYLVVNKQGIVRYHAALQWPHGSRYHLDEIRGAIDSLVTPVLDTPDTPPSGIQLTTGQNPARGDVRISLALPAAAGRARVQVLDVGGRVVETLADGGLAAGTHAFVWQASTGRAAPGVYLVSAQLDGQTVTRRVAFVR